MTKSAEKAMRRHAETKGGLSGPLGVCVGDGLEALRSQLESVPDKPGVYLWKDADGAVLYVGKAKELKKRMKQYVAGHDERVQIPLLMARVATFDYIVTRNEHESLVLETNLVNEMSPPFNVDLKDDKSFPFIAITTGNTYPGIKYTRERHIEKTRYFGPYTDARAARSVLDTVRRLMPMCRCTCPEWKRIARDEAAGRPFTPSVRPCFDSHIGLGPGVCQGAVDADEYRAHVGDVAHFLQGRYTPLIRELTLRMQEASGQLDFETAAGYRNRLDAIEMLKEKQTVVCASEVDMDVIGVSREETVAGVFMLIVRDGRVLNSGEFVLDKGLDTSLDALLSGFITRYYIQPVEIPPLIALEASPEDGALLNRWLTERRRKLDTRAGAVRIIVPKRGEKRALVEMATRNARHALARWMVRTHYEDGRINEALAQLESALALTCSPYRIECYDISTLHGTHSVGSMVVFAGGKKDAGGYRRFRIRAQKGHADDVAMIREVLTRRFAPRNADDARFASLPDLIVIDGGTPQLKVARETLEALGLDIEVVGLAKREEEVFVIWQDLPVVLPQGSPSLYLMKRIRDEAHRFALEYHRLLRSKAMTASVLDEVIGIGPKKRKALIQHFGSLKKLRDASIAEIAQVKGITEPLAVDIHTILHLDASAPEPTEPYAKGSGGTDTLDNDTDGASDG